MKFIRNVYIIFIITILLSPIFVVISVGFNQKKSLRFPPEGFTLDWYTNLWFDEAWRISIFNSLSIAFSASILATFVALPLAYSIWRFKIKFSNLIYIIGLSPFILPPVVSAIGFLSFWATLDLYGSRLTIILSHSVFLTTLPLLTITLGLRSINLEIIDAAESLGATEYKLFRSIIIPLITPYIFSGLCFAFVLSLNEYIITFMLVGFTVETVPVKIFNSLRYGYTPTMAAASAAFVLSAGIIFSIIAWRGNLLKLLGVINER